MVVASNSTQPHVTVVTDSALQCPLTLIPQYVYSKCGCLTVTVIKGGYKSTILQLRS